MQLLPSEKNLHSNEPVERTDMNYDSQRPSTPPPTHDSSEIEAHAHSLIQEYREHARSFLSEHLPEALDGLDRRVELAEQALQLRTRLDIGFVGESQVGKSTLLNAVLGTHALPSGGIGPLTAQPTLLRYAENQQFTAHYHSTKKLNELRFAVEEHLRRTRGASLPPPQESELESELLEAVVDEHLDAKEGDSENDQGAKTGDELLNQLRVIFGVSEDSGPTPEELVFALRTALGQLVPPQSVPEDLQTRALEVSKLIGTQTTITEEQDRTSFLRELSLRAAGWQSPLVSQFELESNAAILRHLNLVDLPGVGTINDPSQLTTREFVRGGDALAVVVRNNGITDAVTQLLERSGFFTRLLFAGNPENPPIHMMVVVTHLDNVARQRRSELKAEARARGERAPTLGSVFQSIATEMDAKIREQLLSQLRHSPSFAELNEEAFESRSQMVETLTSNLRVHCVVAPDALELQVGDEEDANIKDIDETGVPGLNQALIELASEHLADRTRRVTEATQQLESLLNKQITNVSRKYEEDSGVVGRFVRRFREVSETILPVLREKMQGQNGRVHAVLTEGIPRDLDSLSRKAEIQALKKLQWLRDHGQGLHYASLNAALRRAGRWDNRGIDYPGHLTRVIVDLIASGWVKTVVEPVREIMQELVSFHIRLIDDFLEGIQVEGEAQIDSVRVDSQIESMRSSAESCVPWTDSKLDKFREAVSQELSEEVEKPIAEGCQRAVQAGRNRGAGAKVRILEVFQESGSEAIEKASGAARKVLERHFQLLLGHLIEGYLKEHSDPLQRLSDTIIEQEKLRKAEEWDTAASAAKTFIVAFHDRHHRKAE